MAHNENHIQQAPVIPLDDWKLLGNAATNASVNFIGTTDNQHYQMRTNNLNAWQLNKNGVLVKFDTPTHAGWLSNNITSAAIETVQETTGGFGDIHVSSFGTGVGSWLLWKKAGGTFASPTIPNLNDTYGSFVIQAYDGTIYRNAVFVEGKSDNAPGNTMSATSMPSQYRFYTIRNGTTALRNNFAIRHNGFISFGAPNGLPVSLIHANRWDAANALPATTGTVQSNGHLMRLESTGNNTILDSGTSTTQAWVQAVDKTNLATGREYLLNPNRGNVGISTTQALSSLDADGSLGLAIRVTAIAATLGTSDSTVVLTATVTQPLPAPILRRVYHIKNGGVGTVTVTGHIDNTAANTIIIPSGSSRTFHSDGTTWWMI